jgi:hypothetical protein
METAPASQQAERTAGQRAAAPVPNQTAGGGGQLLPSTVRALMEPRLGYDLRHVRIHTDASAARSADRLDADAYTYGSHIAFAAGRFAPGSGDGNALIAHELVHSIQQMHPPPLYASGAAPMSVSHAAPQIARRPKKTKKPKEPAVDVPKRLGTNAAGEEVLVVREVGGTSGYDQRLQAIAVARLYDVEPAVIVQEHDGKWHVYQTTASLSNPGPGGDIAGPIAYGLPSAAGIDAARQSQPNSQRLASLVFGVPESEVQMNRRTADAAAGKVNVNADLTGPNAPGGVHDRVGGGGFEKGDPSALGIPLESLADPAAAQEALFHESTHLRDYELAQQWVATYERETTGTFFSGSRSSAFTEWLYKQTRTKPPRLSYVDAELIADVVRHTSGSTEANANVLSFLVAFQAGKTDLATRKLVAYARQLKPGGLYQPPETGSAVQRELTAELHRVDKALPKDQQAKFRAAFAAARAINPEAWVSLLVFGK